MSSRKNLPLPDSVLRLLLTFLKTSRLGRGWLSVIVSIESPEKGKLAGRWLAKNLPKTQNVAPGMANSCWLLAEAIGEV